jgi:hypothetical protein
LDDNGGFKASTPITFTDGSTGTFTLNGTISLSGTASGTLTWSHNYSPGGTASSCASGTVTWSGGTGASAPAPPVGPKLGHYTGTTTQNNHFAFDLIVNASGYLEATNVALDEMDESCTPQANLTVPAFYFGSFQFFVNAGGHMHAAFTADGESFILDATIDSTGHATGTAHDSNVVPYEGTTYSCDSGPVSWTATLG